MTRYYDVNQNCVVYGDTLLPMEAFLTTETVEMKLVNNVFEFAKTIAELKLTDTELGLYSALVLLQAGKKQHTVSSSADDGALDGWMMMMGLASVLPPSVLLYPQCDWDPPSYKHSSITARRHSYH